MTKTAVAHVNGAWITTRAQLRAAVKAQYLGGPRITLVSINVADFGQTFEINSNVSATVCNGTYDKPLAVVVASDKGWKVCPL
jgi:hypothetical protein